MRKIFRYIVPALLCICLLNACKKSFHEQQSVPIPDTPDLSEQMLQSVSGFVTNENGSPVFNARITAGDKTTTTDEYGHFLVNDVMLSKTAGFIQVTNPGYFDGYRTFVGIENQETFTRIQLVPKTPVGTINAISGGLVSTADGASVALPSDAVVHTGTNAPYSGNIHVAAHLYKQEDMSEWSKVMPGDLRGTNNEAHLQLLKSYGMLAVELTGDAGEPLQIAAGKEATIITPIPPAFAATAPASIPLWSFDVANGLWKQEGTTTKNGNTYTGNVQHFSFWDGATGVPVVNLTAQIVNNSLQEMGNVFICIRRADDPNVGSSSYTNTQGYVSGAVLANTELVLQVYNMCGGANVVYSQNFTTTNANVNMGTITANLGDLVTVTGSAVNCSNAPVTNGWVMLIINNVTYKVQITNGSFNFTTATCANMNSTYMAVDYGASQQGLTQNITLVSGANNLGTLIACGVSTVGFLDYSIDGNPTIHVTEPRDTMKLMAAYDGQVSTNILTIDWDGNVAPNMRFAFNGGTSTSAIHTADYFESRGFPTGFGIAQNASYPPIPVSITEYGQPGGFVAGYFDGQVEDMNDHSPHHVHCEFRVRRYGM